MSNVVVSVQVPKTIAIEINRGQKGDPGGGSGGPGGGVSSVTGVSPITSTSGATPAIAILPASGSTPGSMSASDFSKLAAATAINTPGSIVLRDGNGAIAFTTATGSLTGTASNASNLNNQAPAFYLNRANHSGSQPSSTINDFDAQVRSSRLDQFAVPTSAVSLNSQRITGLAAPQNGTDAVNKDYVESLSPSISGLGLLVYAQQNTALPLTPYIYTPIPFSTEIFDPSSLFSNGIFTPAITGIYRAVCHLHLRSLDSLSIVFYGVQVWEDSDPIETMYRTDTYVNYAINSHSAELPLTAGVPYHFRVSVGGDTPTIAVASEVKNTLTIERLS